MQFDLLIRGATIVDGTGRPAQQRDVRIKDGRIASLDNDTSGDAAQVVDASGLHLAPGFIDVHTHDDINVIRDPSMLTKISQGVTTVIVGNCGISASPVEITGQPPDPMNLLGSEKDFRYANFSDYVEAVTAAKPHTNVAALVGHTALRIDAMHDIFRAATNAEIQRMKQQLERALADGAIGLSSGLAYPSANHAPTNELISLMDSLAAFDAIYATHLRTESDAILDALQEAFDTANRNAVPLIVSHMKCAGSGNWGRSTEVIDAMERAAKNQQIACDCYPYSASSSTLDIDQVDEDAEVFITWSDPFPDVAGQTLSAIAEQWQLPLLDTARKLQPAGAVYHCMSETDVQAFLKYKRTMIGSDGLPGDPHPHPRLWGTFPRFIGHYCRDLELLDLPEAIHKMTGLSATNFRLENRGTIDVGNWADMVLFDLSQIKDRSTFKAPQRTAKGIIKVWVNGQLSYTNMQSVGDGAGRFLLGKHHTMHETSVLTANCAKNA